MKVTLVQYDIAWESVDVNIRRVREMVNAIDTDMIVLPEMWATGFSMTPSLTAEKEASSRGLLFMKALSTEKRCAVCGSLAIQDTDGTYRNRFYFVTPESVIFYDKRHLFTHGQENLYYTCGNQAVIVRYQGLRFLLQTCYDLRFPVFSRYGRTGEYDAIIYVANWPQSRRQAWDILTRARAIENQSFVIAVNRTGSDPKCTYDGGSIVADPKGSLLCQLSSSDTVAHVELDLELLVRMRSRFKVLADRDTIL